MRTIIGSLAVVFLFGCSDPPPKTSDDATATADATSTAPPDSTSTADPVSTAPTQTAPPTATTPPVEDGPALVFEGLKVKPVAPAKVKKLEIGPDGAVMADGKPVATFAKNTVLDEKGTAVLRVNKDGSVTAMGQGMSKDAAKFTDTDDLQTPDGKLSIGKDGLVTYEKAAKPDADPKAKPPKPEKGPIKFEGLNEKNRRAAVLLATYMIMLRQDPAPGPAGTSQPASTGKGPGTAAPPGTAPAGTGKAPPAPSGTGTMAPKK